MISPAVIQRTVKDIVEVEKRSKNVIIFGMEEQDEEDVGERVSEIFDAVGEKQDLRYTHYCSTAVFCSTSLMFDLSYNSTVEQTCIQHTIVRQGDPPLLTMS